ncbi:MAG: cob(I)yrinic acid a,c-diamide adenosyltransferase [Acidobacteriota bacterium]
MNIYTRTGDQGETSLFSGERVGKDDLRVEVYGTLDELNSVLGLARSLCENDRVQAVLAEIQGELFTAGADLATRSNPRSRQRPLSEENWRRQEKIIDQLSRDLPKLKNFLLPGGSPASSALHLGRSVCRRAERLLVRLMGKEKEVNRELLIYLNRLSDLLFVLARYENVLVGSDEIIWKGQR